MMRNWNRTYQLGFAAALLALAGCNGSNENLVQGYVEGEYIYVACPSASALEKLYVARGNRVGAGEPLFTLDSRPEKAARDEAQQRLAQAQSMLADARKGRRPTEIESLEASLKQAKAALALSEVELKRQATLRETGAGSIEDFDRARARRDEDFQKATQLEADLKTGKLGLRDDQVKASEADVQARTAALAKAEWDLSQKQQFAPKAGLVFDTLFYEGEWVPAGRPVVALLPPGNVKVRAFVPERRIGSIQLGQRTRVFVDHNIVHGGTVSFISPQAEYTPPVIYSQESRAKLVFMVELRFEAETASLLHPGQPVDVEFLH